MKFFESLRQLAGDGKRRRPRDAAAVAAEIASVEAALAQAATEEAAARERLASAEAGYDALLLADADYEAKQAHRRQVEEAEDLVRALPLFKRQQERRLADLRAELRQQKGMVLRRRVEVAGADYLTAMRNAVISWQALLAVRDGVIRGGFGDELLGWAPLPLPVDLGEHVRLFDEEAARLSASAMPAKSAPSRPAATPSAAAPAPSSVKAAKPLAAPPPARPSRVAGPPADGELQILVCRADADLSGNATIGDTVNLPEAHARSLIERGAATFIVEVKK